MSDQYSYDGEFFDFVTASSARSAQLFLAEFVRVVLGETLPASVLDIGCGRGAWLADWRRQGVQDTTGVDGSYVAVDSLVIPVERFAARDLSRPLDLGRRFELVQCLEVAEHLHARDADTLVDSMTRHGEVVLFSAATPGQGGEFHVNEQPHEYWRGKFARRGFEAFDAIRPAVAAWRQVEPWYRFNAFVYASQAGAARLSAIARSRHVPANVPLADVSPLWWRLRCRAIAAMPPALSLKLARIKHRAANLAR